MRLMRRVLLLGDSIRMRYQPYVREALTEHAVVTGPSENCETSRKLRARVAEWLQESGAAVVHVNCGLHDIRIDPGCASPQVPLAEYVDNLRHVLGALVASGAAVVWASSTPIDEHLHSKNKLSRRRVADLLAYNRAAIDLVRETRLEFHDLFGVMASAGPGLLQDDGVHYTDEGYRLMAKSTAEAIRAALER